MDNVLLIKFAWKWGVTNCTSPPKLIRKHPESRNLAVQILWTGLSTLLARQSPMARLFPHARTYHWHCGPPSWRIGLLEQTGFQEISWLAHILHAYFLCACRCFALFQTRSIQDGHKHTCASLFSLSVRYHHLLFFSQDDTSPIAPNLDLQSKPDFLLMTNNCVKFKICWHKSKPQPHAHTQPPFPRRANGIQKLRQWR